MNKRNPEVCVRRALALQRGQSFPWLKKEPGAAAQLERWLQRAEYALMATRDAIPGDAERIRAATAARTVAALKKALRPSVEWFKGKRQEVCLFCRGTGHDQGDEEPQQFGNCSRDCSQGWVPAGSQKDFYPFPILPKPSPDDDEKTEGRKGGRW